MAEAILSDIAVGLISKASSLLLNEIVLRWGVKDELEKLKEMVDTVEAVILHAEEQSIEDPQVKQWLGKLGEVMYDAEDLLDEFSTMALHVQLMSGSEISKKVRLFFSNSNQLAFGLKMAHKVKALIERFDHIAANRRFHLQERSYAGRGFLSRGRDQTHSSPPQVVIGREQEKDSIVELLLSPNYQENIPVVCIVGLGGLGKTTLAQLVYNDDRVQNRFELKMWVCVSDDFELQLLVQKALESASGQAPLCTQMDPLKNLLHEHINGRRYLLVLDDVWNEDVNRWSCFKDLLAGGARGSKILITTRLRKVAELSRPILNHDIRGLSENEAWSLFKHIAFKQGQLPHPSLEAMGKEIVTKCYGVPLAIKAIAGMLYFKDLESEWVLFKDKELLAIDVFKHDILPILKLSYNHLPSHYKHCFAYCSLFPKGYPIPVDKMIQLWKAQGYIKSTNSNECLHDIGFGYFSDLFRMSFFQDVREDAFGNIKYCRMHDLMHDLANSIAGDAYFMSHLGTTSINDKTQHVSFQILRSSITQNFSSMLRAKKMHTLLSLNRYGADYAKLDAAFRHWRCLRVLDSSMMKNRALPNSISKLRHLRYLDLSHNINIRKIPNAVTSLYNLQVLNLQYCVSLMQLPSNITKLVNLTDLDNTGCLLLSHIPRGIGKLTRLEKLSEFVISRDHSMWKPRGGIDELHSLNDLRGDLEIKNLRNVKNSSSEYTEARLSLKEKLQTLILHWGWYVGENDEFSAEDVAYEEMGIEALCPHSNLKQLTVSCYAGVRPPSWLPSITNLVSLEFDNCKSIQRLLPLNKLLFLKRLQVFKLSKLEHIDIENGRGSSFFFPSLTHLTLIRCPNLKGFERPSTQELLHFPRLCELEIHNCPSLTYLPCFPELKKMKSDGEGMKPVMEILNMQTNSASGSISSHFSTLSQLQHLHIGAMENPLEVELIRSLPSLQSLSFSRCSFKTVCRDEKDDGMQWQSVKVLNSIEFREMVNLVSLPKGLYYATTLQHLNIFKCPSLGCMPEWMPKLIALQDLTLTLCPQLEERCGNNLAEDWPKISHIPNICIEGVLVQQNGCYQL